MSESMKEHYKWPERIRCGDVVRVVVHEGPEGEAEYQKWTVAYADYSTGLLAPVGWPDCEYPIDRATHLECATQATHDEIVRTFVLSRSSRRRSKVRELYPEAWERAMRAGAST